MDTEIFNEHRVSFKLIFYHIKKGKAIISVARNNQRKIVVIITESHRGGNKRTDRRFFRVPEVKKLLRINPCIGQHMF